MSDPIYKGAYSIGNGKGPVVINTSGKVVIKVRDKYFPLNFESSSTNNSAENPKDTPTVPILIVAQRDIQSTITTLSEDTLLLSPDGGIYLFYNKALYNIQTTLPDNGTFNMLTVNKLTVKSAELVPLLNANYLEGKPASEFARLKDSASIQAPWVFQQPITVNQINGDNIYLDGATGVMKVEKLGVSEIQLGDIDALSVELKNIQDRLSIIEEALDLDNKIIPETEPIEG